MRSIPVRTVAAAIAIMVGGLCTAVFQAEQATGARAGASQVSAADRDAILSAVKLKADAKGRVRNDCGDMITPQLLSVELGQKVGPAVLLVMTGGPTQATCYGDGPGLTLFRRAAKGWAQIYTSRGASLVVMKQMHNGAPDLVSAGPGSSHPVFEWNGTEYLPAKRDVPDDKLGDGVFLP